MLTIEKTMPELQKASVLTSAGFIKPLSPELTDDVKNHLYSGGIVYSLKADDELIGFSVFHKMFDNVLYLAGMMINPAFQASGIAAKAILQARAETGASYLALRSQSTRMWLVGNRLCIAWTPHPQDVNPEIERLAYLISQKLNMSGPIAPGFYGQPLYGKKPLYHDKILQDWWDSLCNFERGDAILCVGKFR